MDSHRAEIFNLYRRERMRIGQGKAVAAIIKLVAADQRFISVVLPTRYGKSDVIRMTAFELASTRRSATALVLSPNTLLRDQLVNRAKVDAMLDRYDARFGAPPCWGKLVVPVESPNVNGEWLLSATIQLVQRNLDSFASWVRREVRRTGNRVLVYIDEAHTGSTGNRWGEVARVLADAGAIIILLTATPFRADNDPIAGFRVEVLSEAEVKRFITRDGSQPHLRKVEIYQGCERVIRLVPDFEYTLANAWLEDPLPIAKIDWLPFAVDLNQFRGGDGSLCGSASLSEMNPGQVRNILGRVVRDPKVVDRGVSLLVRKLRELKTRCREVAAIVFCGNDQEDDPDFNMHAKVIRDLIRIVAPDLKVVIATSSTDDGQATIEAFRDGEGDVLIVKQMASVGLDAERLKVALDLSPVRTAAAFLQRLMRIATVHRNFVGIYIAPDEPIGKALFERFVASEGGEATVADLEKVKEYEVPREERPQDVYTVNGTDFADFGDSDQNWADKDLIHKVEAFRRMVPEVVGNLSHASIAARIEAFGWQFTDGPPVRDEVIDTDVAKFTLRKSIHAKVSEVIKVDRARRGLDKTSAETYGETSQRIWGLLYRTVGGRNVPLGSQNDLIVLRKLDAAADRLMAVCDPEVPTDG